METLERIKQLVKEEGLAAVPFDGDRAIIASAQVIFKDAGHDPGLIDGLYGPATEAAAMAYFGEEFDRGEDNPHGFPNMATIRSVYGEPCDHSNLMLMDLPYPMRLAWDLSTSVKRLKVHKLVAPSLYQILQTAGQDYGMETLQRMGLDITGGAFNCRKMRGGSSYSTHSWGVAIDIDPANNQLRWGRDRAQLARPEYEHYHQLFEAQGWINLGRVKNYDWMHFQAIRP